MIQKAVKELNERNGSTEEAISEFIKNEFQDLPWAHTRILGLHLGKLCQAKELLRAESGRYMLMTDDYKFDGTKEKGWRGSKRRKKSKRGRNHGGGETLERSEGAKRCNELQERENEGQNRLSELHGTRTSELIEEQGKSEIRQLGVPEEGHGPVVQGQGKAETRQNENADERIQEAIMELNNKIGSSEIMNMEPHMVEKQNSMVIKEHVQFEKPPDNLLAVTDNQTLIQQIEGTTEISRFCSYEISNNENLSTSLGSPTVAENQCEKQPGNLLAMAENQTLAQPIEATTEISRFCSDEISNNKNLSASLDSPTDAENQREKQPYNLLAVVENQTLTKQIEATTDISRFYSDEISDDEYLSALLGSPTVSVIPKEKLQISRQEQDQNGTPSIQQKFSGACELLVDQEGPVLYWETICSSQPTAPDLPVDLTSDSQNCLSVPISTEFFEHTPPEGIELTHTQLLVQASMCGILETDLCPTTKTLASMIVHEHKQPQDDILGSPEGRVDENTTFGDLEKHMLRPQCSERQPNQETIAGYPEVSLLPSDSCIVDKQMPRYYDIKRKPQLQPQGQGRGRGRERSPNLDRNLYQHKEQLQLQDQALASVSFPSLEPNEPIYSLLSPNLPASFNQQQLVDPISEESPGCLKREISQLQLELQMSWHRLVYGDLGAMGTAPKMEYSLSSLSDSEDNPLQHGNKRGRKRRLNLDGQTEFGHLEQQLPKRRRRGRPPNPVPTKD